jgi:hypothetical protein
MLTPVSVSFAAFASAPSRYWSGGLLRLGPLKKIHDVSDIAQPICEVNALEPDVAFCTGSASVLQFQQSVEK